MSLIQYSPVNDPEIVQEVQQRFFEQTSMVKSLGFIPLATVGEKIFPFSLLLVTPIYWMMKSSGEVLRTGGLLQFTNYYPLWVQPEQGVIAEFSRLSVKLYARYADGTVLMTNNNPSSIVANERIGLIGKGVDGAPQDAWAEHLRRMDEQRMKNGQQIPLRTFEQWMEISRLQEKAGAGSILGAMLMWLAACAVPLVGLAALLNALGVISFAPGGAWRLTPERLAWRDALPFLRLFLLGLVMLGGGYWLERTLNARRKQSGPASVNQGRPGDQQASRIATALMFALAIGTLFLLVMFTIYIRGVR